MNIGKLLIQSTRPLRYAVHTVTFRLSNEASRLERLRDLYKGAPLLVVGNGPSLNRTPLDEFIHVPSIGMNKIDLIFPRTDWRPSFIICVNSLVLIQHRKNYMSHDVPLIVPWKARFAINRYEKEQIYYFHNSVRRNFSCDVTRFVGASGTVTYSALQFAYFMGADPVIIVGVDHHFSAKGEPNAVVRKKGPDHDHFDPNYFAPGQYWGLPNLELSEKGYRRAKEAFEAAGRRIYDATVGGKLNVFPKISIEQALELVKDAQA